MKIKALISLVALSAAAFSFPPSAFAEVPSAQPPPVDHYVYLSFLPKASELAQDAKANGLTILRLDELSDRVIVSYKYPDGHTATLGYALLGSAGDNRPVTSLYSSGSPSPVAHQVYSDGTTVATPAPQVVYVDPGYRSYYYADPLYDFWAPLTLGIGLGWATTWHGGGHYYHGGYHGGGYYHGGGGWHGGRHR